MAGIPYRINKKKTRIRSGKKITTSLYLGNDKIESQNTSDTLEQLSVSSLYGKKKFFSKKKLSADRHITRRFRYNYNIRQIQHGSFFTIV